jgi:hypothetical protein
MDPGTAAILTLSAITGISGYGAMKLNAKAKATIDEQVKLAIGDAQAKIAEAQKAQTDAEQKVNTLKAYIDTIERVKKQLESEKSVLSENLEKASELEKTFRELPAEVFKQAINDFKAKPEIVTLGHPEFFEPLLSRFSVTRGTARSLYAKFKKVVVDIMPKPKFDELLLDALKNGATSLEERQKKEAEVKNAKAKEVEAKALAEADVKAKAKAEVEAKAQAKRDIAATEAAEIRTAALKQAFEESKIRKEEAATAKAAKDAEAIRVKEAKDETARLAKEAKKVRDEQTALAALRSKIDKNKAEDEAAEAKAAKDARTLQQIVDQALAAAKVGPLTSNTLYQKVKTPFLDGVNSVARGVQKAVDVTKQAATTASKATKVAAKKATQLIRTPFTAAKERAYKFKEGTRGGAGDTFDTDVNYRLFHPKEGDAPNEVLADLFRKTSTDTTLAKNMLPVFDAFMYWRSTVLNYPLLYKIELVISAQNLFRLVEPSKVNAVFQNKDLAKAMEAVKPVGTKEVTTRINPMSGRTFNAADTQVVNDEPDKEFKEIINEPPKEPKLTVRTPVGGTRKKKLRTRRRDKQNVRRTRRSQNRPNRTDTYSSRRSEVDASGDELGL